MIENIKKLDEEKLQRDRMLNGHCHVDHNVKSRSTAPISRLVEKGIINNLEK